VATVPSPGVVTAVGNGSAQITAASGSGSATANVTVAQTTASVSVTPATSSFSAAGATAQLTAQAMDASNSAISGKTFTWTSDAPSVATVNESGLVTSVANGAAHISASADGVTGSATVTVLVAAKGAPPIALPTLPTMGESKTIPDMAFRRVRRRETLTPAARSELDKYAIAIQAVPDARWELGGYTDSRGSRAINIRLARERATAVKDYLVSKGVSASSVTVVGYGPVRFIATNRTARGRAENRRIELKRLQ
jgi:outer membrane protein OmpA-like peptidoglycan-associated protein